MKLRKYTRRPAKYRPPGWKMVIVLLAAAVIVSAAGMWLWIAWNENPVTIRAGSTSQGDTTIFGRLDVSGETTLHGPVRGNEDGYIWLRDRVAIESDGSEPQLTIRGAPGQLEPVFRIQEISGDSTLELDYGGNMTVTGNIRLANDLWAVGAPQDDVKILGSMTGPLTVTEGVHTIFNFDEQMAFAGFYAGGCSIVGEPSADAALCSITGNLWPEDQGEQSGFQIQISVLSITGTLATEQAPVHWWALVRP